MITGPGAAVLGVYAVLLYYFAVWMAYGVDPARGSIVARYEPPEGYSAGLVRYLWRMGFDDKVVVAGVLGLVAKRMITVVEGSAPMELRRGAVTKEQIESLPEEEQELFQSLFPFNEWIILDQTDHFAGFAVREYHNALARRSVPELFSGNRSYVAIGYLVSVAAFVWYLQHVWNRDLSDDIGATLLVSALLVGLAIYSYLFFRKQLQQSRLWWRMGRKFRALNPRFAFLGLVALGVTTGAIVALTLTLPTAGVAEAILLVAINVVFFHLMQAPTRAGRKIMDAIEGFRVFLNATEADRLKLLNPPERTPSLYQKFLPFAVALDVEQRWGKTFEGLVQEGSAISADSNTWYLGTFLGVPMYYSSDRKD